MTDLPARWFEPHALFCDGYPDGLSSAVRELDDLRRSLRDAIDQLAPSRILEIGPGDCPVARPDQAVFLDVAPGFLHRLPDCTRVIGDILAAPFADHSFDVVFAGDVLTHIVPELRPTALANMVRLGGAVCVFNPEPGTPEVPRSPVPTELIESYLAGCGHTVETRRFRTQTQDGPYDMALITARPGPARPDGSASG